MSDERESGERESKQKGDVPVLFLSFVITWTNSFFSLPICASSIHSVHMSMPPMLAAAIFTAYAVSNCLKPPNTKAMKAHRKAQTIKLLLGLILFMYPGLATRCFQMFKCSQFEGLTYRVLEADPSMICDQSEHTLYVTLALIFIGVYVIGIPFGMLITLWKNKKHLYVEKGQEPTEKQKDIGYELGGMYMQYEPRFWYFEIIIIMHKCLMTGAMVVVGNGTPLQPLVAMLIQMMFLLLVLKMAPYNDDLDDWSSFVCSLALTLTTLAGFLLMVAKKEQSEVPDVIAVETLTSLLIGINGLCFVYEMIVIGYVSYQEKMKKRRKGTMTQVKPVQSMNDKDNLKHWGK